MESDLVHYEVFVRKSPTARWVLELATEKPHVALATAEDLVTTARVAAAMVTKETFDERQRVFHSETLFNQAVEGASRKTTVGDWDPLCLAPPDLYTDRARDRIGKLVEDWLGRNGVTVFELLHNAELVERLEAASTEMQHAIQKFAVAEVQLRGGVTHEIIRRTQTLLDKASARLLRDHRRGAFPPAEPRTFANLATTLAGHPEAAYLLGGSVVASTLAAGDWRAKVRCLLDLIEAAPDEGPGRTLALDVIDQLLAEALVSEAALQGLVGDCDTLGGSLAALVRLISPQAAHRAMERDPRLKRVFPELSEEARQLAERLSAGQLRRSGAAAAKQVLSELQSHRRLHPDDPQLEVMTLRGLAMALAGAPVALTPEEDVATALGARSRAMLSTDFLEAYVGEGRTAREEAEALVWLASNVVGTANKRRAGRLLQAVISSLRFETEATAAGQSPAAQLSALAALQRLVSQSGLMASEAKAIATRLGQFGKLVEGRAQLVDVLLRSDASPVQKLAYLLRLASGEAAPLGPAADRAREEALKLVRDDSLRAELARDESQLAAVRELIQQAGLAA